MSFRLIEMSFTIFKMSLATFKMSFGIFFKMSFSQNARKKSLSYHASAVLNRHPKAVHLKIAFLDKCRIFGQKRGFLDKNVGFWDKNVGFWDKKGAFWTKVAFSDKINLQMDSLQGTFRLITTKFML